MASTLESENSVWITSETRTPGRKRSYLKIPLLQAFKQILSIANFRRPPLPFTLGMRSSKFYWLSKCARNVEGLKSLWRPPPLPHITAVLNYPHTEDKQERQWKIRVECNLAIKQSYVAVFSSNSFEKQLQKKKTLRFLSSAAWLELRDVFRSGDVYFIIYVRQVDSSNFYRGFTQITLPLLSSVSLPCSSWCTLWRQKLICQQIWGLQYGLKVRNAFNIWSYY